MASLGSLVADMRLNSAAFTRDLGRASRDISSKTAQMRRGMRSVETASRGVSRSFAQLRVGATALIGALALGQAARGFANYETTLQQIVGLVGVAQSEVDRFNKALLEMGPAVGKGPGELAEALFFITSAGLKGDTALSALRDSAKAATAGLGETKAVADAVTSAMNAYASANLTSAQATDVLVATVREGKLEASQLATAIGQVLSVAEDAGVRFDEVGASVASLTRIGIQTSEAVTGLRGVLVALAKESSQGTKVLTAYSTSYAELRKNIKERGLLTTLTELRKTIGGNETALVKIFGRVEAVNTVLALTGANAEGVRGIFDRMKDSTGALDAAFAAVADTTGFRFNASMARLAKSGIEIGDVVMPKLATAVELVAANIREITAAVAAFIAFRAAIIFGGIAVAAFKMAAALRAVGVAGLLMNKGLKLKALAGVLALGVAAAILLSKNSEAATASVAALVDMMGKLGESFDKGKGDGGDITPPGADAAAVKESITALKIQASQYDSLAGAISRSAEEHKIVKDVIEEENAMAALNVKLVGKQAVEWRLAFQAMQKSRTEMEKVETATAAAQNAAEDLGLTFESAFEDAVIEGKKFRDVLKAIAADIARIILRRAVTEPLGDAVSKTVGSTFAAIGSSIDFSSIFSGFGGANASGGPTAANTSYLVGERGPEMFVPRTAGDIVPNGTGNGGNTYNIDARGADAGAVSRIERALFKLAGPGVTEHRAVTAVVARSGRGGSVGRALRG